MVHNLWDGMERLGILDLEVQNRMAVVRMRDVVVVLLTREGDRRMALRGLRVVVEWVPKTPFLEAEEHIGRLPCRHRDNRTSLPKRML